MHDALSPAQRMLVEYKPFEPAFYHTDIADWGMALLLAKPPGRRRKVLVDTGHHYQAQNIEQIVAWLLDVDMLGGFHFNDRRYADDDLTLGSIDPYQVFRIFHEIRIFECETGDRRHRLHDRPEPQPEGQDRSHDPDRHAPRRSSTPRLRWSITRGSRCCRTNASWWKPRSAFARLSGRMCGQSSKAGGDREGWPRIHFLRSGRAAISKRLRANGQRPTRVQSRVTPDLTPLLLSYL